jgi:preprotein translocase subunit SecA
VLNKQREIIYQLRRKVLETSSKKDTEDEEALKQEVLDRLTAAISSIVTLSIAKSEGEGTPNEDIVREYSTIIPFDEASQGNLVNQLHQLHTAEDKTKFLTDMAFDIYNKREEQLGKAIMRHVEKFVMLSVIDNLWMNHLDAMDNLRQGIGLRGYAQKDPLVEYKNEGFRMFEQLMFTIDDEIVHRIYKVQVQHNHAPAEQPVPNAVTNTPESEVSEPKKKPKAKKEEKEKKLSRNDPCWCGSGKKWKKCHYPQTGA